MGHVKHDPRAIEHIRWTREHVRWSIEHVLRTIKYALSGQQGGFEGRRPADSKIRRFPGRENLKFGIANKVDTVLYRNM